MSWRRRKWTTDVTNLRHHRRTGYGRPMAVEHRQLASLVHAEKAKINGRFYVNVKYRVAQTLYNVVQLYNNIEANAKQLTTNMIIGKSLDVIVAPWCSHLLRLT